MRRLFLAALLMGAGACAPAPQVERLQVPAGAAGAEQGDPALAVDPATGDLLIAWMSGDSAGSGIWFARSADGGTTWSAPSRVVAPSSGLHPHGESSPRLITTSRGVLGLAWSNSVPVPGRRWPASNVLFARSTDGGQRWSPAVKLNDDSTSAPVGHSFHGAAWQGDSNLVVAWLDERRGTAPPGHVHGDMSADDNATLYLASSRDLGGSWAASNRALWGAVCPCCRVTLARGPDGQVSAAWRRVYPGSVRDVVVSPLMADPSGEPTRVHHDEWVYPACPDTGPGIGLDGSGAVHVAWFSGREGAAGVYYARAGAAGAAFGEPVALVSGRSLPAAHTTLATRSAGGAYVAYDVRKDRRHVPSLAAVDSAGQIAWQVPLDTADGADRPQVVQLRDGRVVVAWTQTASQRSVRLARVRESGAR